MGRNVGAKSLLPSVLSMRGFGGKNQRGFGLVSHIQVGAGGGGKHNHKSLPRVWESGGRNVAEKGRLFACYSMRRQRVTTI